MKIYDFDDLGIWRIDRPNNRSKAIGLEVVAVNSANPLERVCVCIPWSSLVPFKDEIQRGLHDDIAGALRERLVEIIKGALKEVQEA